MRVKWALVTRLTSSRDVQEQNGSTRVSLSRSTMMAMMHPSGLSRPLIYIITGARSSVLSSLAARKRRTPRRSFLFRLYLFSSSLPPRPCYRANGTTANIYFTWFMSRRWLISLGPKRYLATELVFLVAHRWVIAWWILNGLLNLYITCHMPFITPDRRVLLL